MRFLKKQWNRWIVLCSLGVCLSSLWGCQKKSRSHEIPTIVYMVRHAEKAKKPKRNPPLQKVGFTRARALRRMLHSVPLHAVYATQYKRTRQTVAPVANAKHLPVTIVGAHKLDTLIRRIRSVHKGKSVLISGHSNTIPMLIQKLGLPFKIRLHERTGYDNLFMVTLYSNQAPLYQRFHFGPMPPK